MANWRARSGAAALSLLLHALLIFLVAGWQVTQPALLEPDFDRVVVRIEPPPQAAAPPAAAPPPPVAQPPAAPPPLEPPVEPPPAAELVEPAEEAPAEPPAEKEPEKKEVEIPLPEQQIVSMPDAGEERPPENTRFLSDRDNVVEQETVKRGEPQPSLDQDGDDIAAEEPDGEEAEPPTELAALDRENIGAPPVPPAAEPDLAPQRPAPRDGADRPLPKLESLLPNALELAAQQAKNGTAPTPEARPGGGAPPSRGRQRSAAAWQPSTTLRGTLDYLPDVQPGNVTLLNTKAELFAPFVRRVMLRVFQNMMILMKRRAPSMRPGVSEQIQAEAIMSPQGEMLSLRITDQSTSMSIGLDRLLSEACQQAFFDRNPPPGAAGPDGKIRFVMQTVVETYPAPGRQAIGFSGLFGVGLL